jgi:phosphoribosylanthranilate isomerase
VRAIAPFGVDVSRGVEIAPGIKGRELIRRFVRAARSMNGVISL